MSTTWDTGILKTLSHYRLLLRICSFIFSRCTTLRWYVQKLDNICNLEDIITAVTNPLKGKGLLSVPVLVAI